MSGAVVGRSQADLELRSFREWSTTLRESIEAVPCPNVCEAASRNSGLRVPVPLSVQSKLPRLAAYSIRPTQSQLRPSGSTARSWSNMWIMCSGGRIRSTCNGDEHAVSPASTCITSPPCNPPSSLAAEPPVATSECVPSASPDEQLALSALSRTTSS